MCEVIYEDVIRPETLNMDRGEREEMMVDIYEDLDSARSDVVMINTEKRSTERQQALRHTGRVSVKNRRHRSVQVCLCLLSVLLFTAVIVICVYFNNERKQLLTHNYILTEERDQFKNKLNDALTDLWSSNLTWIYYNFSLYYISSDYKNWSDSRRDCEEKGADLLIINNKEEELFLRNRTGFNIWIGLTKLQEEWKWVDGTTLTSGYWIDGHSIHSDCAFMTANEWDDDLCHDAKYRWICERRIV